MPSPPLSPIPRRIITPSMVDLLSGLEAASERDRQEREREREEEEQDGRDSPAPSLGPEIRTTSPSPRRGEGVMMSDVEDLNALSPTHTGASLRRYGSPSSPTTTRFGTAPSSMSRYETAPSTVRPPHFISPQVTGQSMMSTTTIDRAFADIHNTLNQLASGPSSSTPTPIADKGKGRAQPISFPHGYPTPPSTNTMASQNTPSAPTRFSPGLGGGPIPPFPLGIPGGTPVSLGLSSMDGRPIFPDSRNEARRLEAVSEHTEPSTVSERSTSPSPSPRPLGRTAPTSHSKESQSTAASIANRFPLPPTPSKFGLSPVSKGATPLSSPSKASDLIRMFESKSGEAPPPQPFFARSSAAKSTASSTPTKASPASAPTANTTPRFDGTPTQRFETTPTAARPTPPSSYRSPPITGFAPPLLGRASPENVVAPLQPSPQASPKSGSPFKNLVASWRSKASSPSLKDTEKEKDSTEGSSLDRSRGWNVSIRRRRRNEDSADLAERAEEQQVEEAQPSASAYARSLGRDVDVPPEVVIERAPSERSRASDSISTISVRPRIVSGEAVRIGSLWYLNVHDDAKAPLYEWVQADARLYKERLRLAWRTDSGAQAMVTFDMEFCEEVASTYSPNHPLAKDDIGTLAAQRQGSLADDLYPFKLVYDDGTERLACTSARDRVRWVNVIWSVLEQTRPPGRSSLHVARPTSIFSSTSDGSASTHHDVQHDLLPPSAPFASTHSSDDAFVPTSAGLHAPIGSRSSRHLAAGPERTRSLRRTVSEADLSESAGPAGAFADLERHSSADTPPALVPEATSSRPVSRDFAFAQQRSPPKHDLPVESAPTPQTVASSALPSFYTPREQISTYRPESMRSDNTFGIASTAAGQAAAAVPPSITGTMYTARQPDSTARPEGTARPMTAQSQATMYTADGVMYAGSPSMHTARSTAFGSAALPSASTPSMYTAQSAAFAAADAPSGSVSMYTASQGLPREYAASSTVQGQPIPSDYLSAYTAGDSAYTTAQLGSPFVHDDRSDRSTLRASDSVSQSGSYHSAPPPVPSHDSHYDTASAGSSELRRYQLHDRPMSSASTQRSDAKSFRSSSRPASVYGTAPPAMSRTSHYASSIYSDIQSGAKTTISEPDTNVDMIADLERQSSAGSEYYKRSIQRRPAQHRGRTWEQSMYTAESQPYLLADPRMAVPSTYATARTSAYTTALGSTMTSDAYHTAVQPSVPVSAVPSEPSQSSSSESSASSSSKSRRVPVPSIHPPPTPSEPSEPPGIEGTVVSFPSTTSGESRVGIEYDLNRMLNYLHGQDTVRAGQSNRMASQLDRIENKVYDISNQLSDAPPPVPAKSRSRSSSTSSSSSTETARPVTPPAFIVPQSITDRLDDMQHVLGELLGQNQSLMDEVYRRRSIDLELPDSGQKRMEEMMRRILAKLGDGDVYDQPFEDPAYRPEKKRKAATVSESEDEASMYDGSRTMYSDRYGNKIPAPPNSYTSEYDRKLKHRFSGVPDSLLDGSIPGSEFDEEFEMRDLPPADPPEEHILPRMHVPTHLLKRRQAPYASAATTPIIRHSPIPEEPEFEEEAAPEEDYPESYVSEQDDRRAYVETEPEEEDLAPMPYRQEDEYERDPSVYSEDYEPRAPTRQLPPPQPVDLPTPVNSLKNMPFNPTQFGGRPPFQGGMPPGPTEMPPRPSLPRIAGVRDPISTTYYRRGFPAPGPMGPMGPMGMGMPGMPMGMFPGPMGIPGPGMGAMMPGLRPGLGGVYGPNAAPHMRRPGFFPPGVPGASGDYGLPAAARYNNTGPSRPGHPAPGMLTPDTGLGNTTSSSSSATSDTTTPSATTQEIFTPVTAAPPLVPIIADQHEPVVQFEDPITHTHTHTTTTVSTDDTLRRAMDQATTMAQASGEQQNEMSRYLHGLNDQIALNQTATERELSQILGDLGMLREELKPKHVMARVLPDGTVVLANGDVIEGVRGAPLPGAENLPPPPPSVPRLNGRVLPDGTIMVGDAIVDGIRGAPQPAAAAEPLAPQIYKDMEQDRKLATLMDKVSELMRRTTPHDQRPAEPLTAGLDILETASTHAAAPTPRHSHTDILREKTVIKEHEVVKEGPMGSHKEVDITEEIERNTMQPPAPTTMPNVSTATPSRVNPRTGKPLSLPQPLSLQPRDPSPIQTDYGLPDAGQLIREEHEEIIQRPGGVPVTTKTTTRTYLRPDGTTVTVADAAPTMPVGSNGAGSMPPATVLGNVPASVNPPSTGLPPISAIPNVPSGPPRAGAAYSDHAAVFQGPTPTVPAHATTSEEITKAPLVPVTDSKNTSTEQTKLPAGPTVGPTGAPAATAPSAVTDKPVWSTNGPKDPAPPKPATSLPNVPSDAPKPAPAGDKPTGPPAQSAVGDKAPGPASGAPAPGPGAGGPPPPSSLGNMPTGPPAGDKPAGGAPPAVAGTPAAGAPLYKPVTATGPSAPASDKPKLGVHWDKHLDGKDPKGPDPNVLKKGGPPPATSLANTPSAPADKPATAPAPPGLPADPAGVKPAGAAAAVPGSTAAAPPAAAAGPAPGGAKPAGPPAPATTANVPGGAAAPGAPAVAGGKSGDVPVGKAPMPTPSVWSTNTPKPGAPPATTVANTPTAAPSAPTSRPATPGGTKAPPPVVPAPPGMTTGSTAPLNPNDKSTRFSDTTAIVPDSSGGEPSTSGTPGKLRKSPPGPPGATDLANTSTAPGAGAADPKAKSPAGGAIAPAAGVSAGVGAPSSKVVHEIPLPAPHQLEEFIMPDGTVAYIKKGSKPTATPAGTAGGPAAPGAAPSPAGPPAAKAGDGPAAMSDKGKGAAAPGPAAAGPSGSAAAPPMALNESAMGHGHCSVCCPSAPKTAAGKPTEPCAHQEGPIAISAPGAPATAVSNKPVPNKLTKPSGPAPTGPAVPPAAAGGAPAPAEPVMPTDFANTATAPAGPSASGGPNKLVKGKGKELSPEEQKMEDARNLATKQKAAAEQAAAEKAQRDAIDKAKADKAKLAEDRHKGNADTLANLQKLLEALQKDQKDSSAAADKRRADKVVRDKKYQETLDKLVVQKEENKKKEDDRSKADVEKAKKEKDGTQAVLDAIQKFGTQEKEFLDRLGKGILEQNSKQHEETRKAAKASARDQVAFNLAGYLDDFSKALSGEVRSLLHEVSGLRETRRALYYELAELLLMKGRQSAGDLMAIMPYPSKPPAKPDDKNKPKPPAPAGDKKPAGIPAWSGWMPPMPPAPGAAPPPAAPVAAPASAAPRPLPIPGGAPSLGMMSGAVPPPPPAPGGRPLPML